MLNSYESLILIISVFTLLFCFDFGKKTSEKSEKEKGKYLQKSSFDQ